MVAEPVQEIDAAELAAWLTATVPPIVVDVRNPDEHAAGALPGAILVPLPDLAGRIASVVADRTTPVAVICAGGARSARAADQLAGLGYSRVWSVRGGFTAWQKAGLPWQVPAPADGTAPLRADQAERYARHLRLPEVAPAGQRRLLDARVLCIGAGGLGSPAALYLAAAGVGTLGIVDDDRVELSNLQRQVLHATGRVGEPKVASAAATIGALNADVQVIQIPERLGEGNAAVILEDYDLVVDGSDNVATRYLVNDVALALGKPVVHAAIHRFEGQLTVFPAGGRPCYRCLFPEAPPPEASPSCAEAGVLGVLPGVLGVLQATEAIKLVLGIGESLAGRLLTYDALSLSFSEVRLQPDPGCVACGRRDRA